MLWTQLGILAVLIVISGFFSGIETALMSLNAVKVNSLLKKKERGSEALHRIKQNPRKLIITILIGNNLINIASASFATVIFTGLFGSAGIGIATGVMTFLILIFGEITPKTFAAENAEAISLKFARYVELLSYLLYPLVLFFELFSNMMLKILGTKKQKLVSEEELRTIVTMGKQEGLISQEAASIMHNVLEFEGTKVHEIMTPKANIEMIEGESKLKDIFDFIVKSPFSRYPIYLKDDDNIVGLLDVDDFLRHVRNKNLNVTVKSVVKPAFFVPETKEVDDLMSDFQKNKSHLAIVVDEYGNVKGLVTVEDVLERIVGKIFDRCDRESVYIKHVNKNLIRVDTKASVEEVNRALHLGLKKEHFDTLAGFIEHKMKKIPKKGEELELKKVTIIVDKVTKQGIRSVKIVRT